jgi:hypothetical protein
MRNADNKGFDHAVVKEYQSRMKAAGKNYLLSDQPENSEEYCHFYFIGKYEGKPVIYDTVLYTLRLQHQSELFEMAEHKAARHFPHYRKIRYEEDEEGNLKPLDELEEEIGLYMAEVILELEEEDQVKVREHVDVDLKTDFGIGLDVGLHVEKITPKAIERFIQDFNEDSLVLDETLYSFQTEEEGAHP